MHCADILFTELWFACHASSLLNRIRSLSERLGGEVKGRLVINIRIQLEEGEGDDSTQWFATYFIEMRERSLHIFSIEKLCLWREKYENF